MRRQQILLPLFSPLVSFENTGIAHRPSNMEVPTKAWAFSPPGTFETIDCNEADSTMNSTNHNLTSGEML